MNDRQTQMLKLLRARFGEWLEARGLEKARVLPGALSYETTPDLVVAFGTAGSREGVGANGSVVVGRRVFIHDPQAGTPNRAGMWTPPQPDQLIDSALSA
jgi:hypothetical protein